MKVVVRRSYSRHAVDVWIFDESGRMFIPAKPVELSFDAQQAIDGESAFLLPDPTMSIPPEKMKALVRSLVDELVLADLMPDPSMVKGELKATKVHLEDMRKIVLERLLK